MLQREDLSFRLHRLEATLQDKLAGRVRELRLFLFDGFGLVLRGTASTCHAKQLAQFILMIETQMPILANEIEIRRSSSSHGKRGKE
jgi:hypothetical protein